MKMPIRVYSPYLDFLHELDTYTSMQFTRRYHEIGEFEQHLNQYVHGAEHFQKGNIVILGDQTHKAGIIRHREIALDSEGKESENWTLKGPTLQGLMSQRLTVPPSGQAHDTVSGDAETVMKHYVERHFVNPDDPLRKIPQLVIAENQHRGKQIDYESRYKKVSDDLTNISKQTGLGWTVYADMTLKKFVFDVIGGKDLTQDNPGGNPPVFFSPDYGTIESQNFANSDLDYRNFGYVGGQGEGVDREVVTVGESSGLERFETFIDARDVDSSDTLTERGEQKLSEMETQLSLEAEILTPVTRDAYEYSHDGYLQPAQPVGHYERKQQQITPFQYEKDFDLGDTVPVVNKRWGVTMTSRITEFREIHEPGGFRLDATFGPARPTLISKIKDRFDELSGVEKQEAATRIAIQKMQQANEYTDRELSKEEQERIEQAQQNLQEAKNYTEGWSEEGATVGAPTGTPVNDRPSQEVDADAQSGKAAKDKIDTDVGSGTIETTTGAQNKANAAEDAANQYTDENSVIKGQQYNGTSITETEGFKAVRGDELVRSILNATEGIKIQRRPSTVDPWVDQFYVDENGKLITKEITVDGGTIVGSRIESTGFDEETQANETTVIDDGYFQNINAVSTITVGHTGIDVINAADNESMKLDYSIINFNQTDSNGIIKEEVWLGFNPSRTLPDGTFTNVMELYSDISTVVVGSDYDLLLAGNPINVHGTIDMWDHNIKEVYNINFSEANSPYLDQYGNFIAPGDISAGAVWQIINHAGTGMIQIPLGSDGGDISFANSVYTAGSSFTGGAAFTELKNNTTGARILITSNGTVLSEAIRNTEVTYNPNVFISNAGTLRFTSSTRKNKILEEPITDDQYKILNIIPKTWYDRATADDYAYALSNNVDPDTLDIPYIERVPGLVAEDVEAAGLSRFVNYGLPDENGHRKIEGVMYDRLWTLLIPVVKDLKERIEKLEGGAA